MGKFSDLIAEASDAPAYFDKDATIGEALTGRVVAISLRQTRDFKTKEPEVWKDGTAREQFVIVLQTGLVQFEGDDGKRSLYIKWWGVWRKAFAKAVLNAANKYGTEPEPELGGTLTAMFTGLGESTDSSLSPAKLFEFDYYPPGVAAETTPAKPAKS